VRIATSHFLEMTLFFLPPVYFQQHNKRANKGMSVEGGIARFVRHIARDMGAAVR
jgi:hypothetical protein